MERGDEQAITDLLAHVKTDPATGKQEGHSLREHLEEVGKLAATFAGIFGGAELGLRAGQWHDLGKYAHDFQRMLRQAHGLDAHLEANPGEDPGAGGRVDHSSAGAVLAYEELGGKKCAGGGLPPSPGQLLAFVIAGHHAGLADWETSASTDPRQANEARRGAPGKLRPRLQEKHHRLEDARKGGAPKDLLSLPLPPLPRGPISPKNTPQADLLAALTRRCEFLTRFIFSALCDADFLDTERFFRPEQAAQRGVYPSLATLEQRLNGAMQSKEDAGPTLSIMQRVRRQVRQACLKAAESPPGFFSLTVPTGGGKTLASMAFALAHARHHRRRRVVVAIPYTSIIEQSAKVYRDVFGAEAVVEHHTAFDPSREGPLNRLASENWDAPIIVTTTVQLFESLFAARPSRCRKLHNLADSIVILDEAQTLPPGLLPTILDGLQTLVDGYGVTIVLATATQPALQRREGFRCGLPAMREIIPEPGEMASQLRRVVVSWPGPKETSWEELAQQVHREPDVLAIVHRRQDAHDLCQALDKLHPAAPSTHMSALMCPQHRSEVLAEVLRQKKQKIPVRLVATQLVEAGVDVDFPVVYRALAGVEALTQAAGRCNREGSLSELGQLRVFRAVTRPPPGILTKGLAVTESMLASPSGLDLFDPSTHERYFRALYSDLAADTDPLGLQTFRQKLCFASVADRFRLIDDDYTQPIVVPHGDARRLVDQLERQKPSRWLLRALQRFTVAIPRSLAEQSLAAGHLRGVAETILFLDHPTAYDQRFGLVIERLKSPGADPARFIING